MKKTVTVTLLIVILVSCKKKTECNYIENYYQAVYLAEEAYYKKDYQKVYQLMSKIETNCELIDQPMIYEIEKFAESAAHIGENKKTFQLIRKLILEGYEITDLETNDAFQNIIKTDEWTELKNDYNSLHKQYLNSINLELRERISEMIRIDQIYNSPNNYDDKTIDSINNINERELKQIIEKYGYPDHKTINPDILLYHFSDYDYWTSTLKELIKKGQASPRSLGSFVDSYQRRVPQKMKYIYGIYDNIGADKIIDFDNLDERRVSIGLPPMKLKNRVDSLRRIYFGD